MTDRAADLQRAHARSYRSTCFPPAPIAATRSQSSSTGRIRGAHEQFPGFEFRLAGDVDGNHHIARFGWELVSTADGSAPVAGSDVVTLDEDGRITSVLAFLDRIPQA